ncbi:hypothetical protein V3851_12910 [Paenibacillus sp. M1]|uniref:Uncharacterized protein n=1 Tax=Paenibacillus haidiansis TaxID=1574488 RepID=A0ABU7VUY4_9BACL
MIQIPAWFQSAIQQRLDHVSARIESHPEFRKLRAEEHEAFDALFLGVDKSNMPGYMEWEDKHLLRRASENERLYKQGLRDGVQLMITLLNDSDPGK